MADKELEEIEQLFREDNPVQPATETPAVEAPATPVVEAKTEEPAATINAPTGQSNTETEEKADGAKAEEPKITAVETPSASTTEASEAETKPEINPQVDLSKLLDETSGGKIKSAEDLKKFLSDFDQAQQQLADPHVEYAKKMRAWEDKGLPSEFFGVVQSTDFSTLDDESIVKFKVKLDNPEWTKEDVELYVEKTYSTDVDSYDEKTVQYGKLRMKQDADRYFNELEDLKEITHVENNPAQVQANQQKLEESRRVAWDQNMGSLINQFTEVQVQVDQKGEKYAWKVTEEERREMADIMKNIVQNAPLSYDEQGKAIFNEILRKEFINRNINKIAQGINNYVSSKKTEEKIVEIHNPSGAKHPAQTPVINKKSAEDELIDNIMKIEG